MSIREFVRLFIPPVYYRTKKRFKERNMTITPLPKRNRRSDKIIIIGNGPSLNKTVENYLQIMQNNECVMVNHSASTPLFEIIKPSVYLMIDDNFINPEENVQNAIYTLIDNLTCKTTWPMTVVMPNYARGCDTIKRLSNNPMIDFAYYHCGKLPKNNEELLIALDNNYCDPPGRTVLNTAVWLGIYWGYPETYIVGADSTFVECLQMDQETNLLYTVDSHFYHNKDVLVDKEMQKQLEQGHRRVYSKLHEELRSSADAFEAYWTMREYADWKGVKVYNACEYSWIDAFERKKLS